MIERARVLLPGWLAGDFRNRRILGGRKPCKIPGFVVEACLVADRRGVEGRQLVRALAHRRFASRGLARRGLAPAEEELGLDRGSHGHNDGGRKDRGQGARTL